MSQALKVRGSADFDSVDEYQQFIEHVVTRLNRRVRSRLAVEQTLLQALPDYSFADYTEVAARVTRSATIEVRRVLYTVPSKLIGERLHIHLHHDRLRAFLGTDLVVTLARVYARGQQRLRQVDYRHVIHALAAKPQAFRYSQLRDDLLPNDRYHDVIGDPTLADAILDRLVHSAYKINLREDSMRKRRSKLTTTPQPEEQCNPRVATLRWVAALPRFGLGGRLQME